MSQEKAKVSVLHLNSCVYEISQNEKGETTNLFKQVNNAIPVVEITIERWIDESWESLKAQFPKTKCFYMFPMDEEHEDAKHNWTVARGVSIEYVKGDPNKPILVEDPTPERIAEARMDALTAKPIRVPFMLAIPETDRYMFDLSLSHVPMDAITHYDSKTDPDPHLTEEPVPIGLDPTKPFISPEDLMRTTNMRKNMEEQIASATANGENLPTDFKFDEEQIMKAGGFESKEEMRAFYEQFEQPVEIAEEKNNG